MSSPTPVERFKGTGWEDCNEFILAIRTRAFDVGKQRDLAWIADFAATNFSHKALSWHARLPQDVRQDWSKLEIALLDRWPSPEDDNEPQIKPAPATAPLPTRSDTVSRPLQGVLKVFINDSNTNYYIKPPKPGVCQLTSDTNEALHVRCNSLPSAILLERIDHSCHSWLAAEWHTSKPTIGEGSTDYAGLTCIASDTLKSPWSDTCPFQLLACTILANGEVIPVWKKDANSKITLFPFIKGLNLYLAADPEAYHTKYGSETRAKLFIEATE